MTAMLRCIEFDRETFATSDACIEWLKTSQYPYIVNQKGFQLRHRKVPSFLTWERRSVWYFVSKDTWSEKKLSILRPERGVCVVLGGAPNDLYFESDIPELLKETTQKLAESAARKEEARAKAAEKKEEKKRKREEEKLKSGSKSKPKAKGKRKSPSPSKTEDPFEETSTKLPRLPLSDAIGHPAPSRSEDLPLGPTDGLNVFG